MKTSALPRLLALGAAILLTLALGRACSDGDGAGEDTASPTSASTGSPTASPLPGITSGPLFDYFTSFREIVDMAESATAIAVERANETSLQEASDEEVVSTMQAYLSDIEIAFTDAIDRLEALNVPDVAITHHRTYLEGVQGSIDAGNSLRIDLPAIETRSELDERLAQFGAEVDAAVEISNGACLALQEIADTEDIAADLSCNQ